MVGREPGVYSSRRWINVGNITLPTGDFLYFGVLGTEVRRGILVHGRIRVRQPILACGRVGEVDDSEVDLTAFAWARVMATLGDGADHEIFTVGSTKGRGMW